MRTQLRHILPRRRHHSLLSALTSPPNPTSNITSFRFIHPHFYSSLASPSTSPSSCSLLWPNSYNFLIGLFSEPIPEDVAKTKEEMLRKIATLKHELIKHDASVDKVMQDLGLPFLSCYSDGSALIELLEQLYDFPLLAVEVFDWRRKHSGFSFPITSEEYAKGIRVAGRAKDLNLAVELFTEAGNNRMKTSTTYNALMSAYMMNSLAEKCRLLFLEFKEDQSCRPTIVTYNILLSVFGRLMLIDHMEATLQEIYDSCLTPNLSTFNNLIAGYLTAWMWDHMENTYKTMQEMSITPNEHTYMLMLRGFAHAGNLKKMEDMYALVKQQSKKEDIQIIRNMIYAYCKNSCANRTEKIDALLKLVPEQYTSWLTVLLIRLYAQEKQFDRMEKFINVALEKDTIVVATDVMKSIATAYYQSDDVDKLSAFVKLADHAGWRLCRSLYHCMMVMYSSKNRLEEMENVIGEMEKSNINSRTAKCLTILYLAYSRWGPKCKLEQVLGLMIKLGYRSHVGELPLGDLFDEAS